MVEYGMPSRKDVAVVLDKLTLAAGESPAVAALWLEGDSPAAARAPAGPLDLHAAISDPDMDLFFRAHESFARSAGVLRDHEDEKAANDGWLCRFALSGGVRVAFSIERKSLLGKRLRKAVVPVVDKTGGQLRFVLSYASSHPTGT